MILSIGVQAEVAQRLARCVGCSFLLSSSRSHSMRNDSRVLRAPNRTRRLVSTSAVVRLVQRQAVKLGFVQALIDNVV